MKKLGLFIFLFISLFSFGYRGNVMILTGIDRSDNWNKTFYVKNSLSSELFEAFKNNKIQAYSLGKNLTTITFQEVINQYINFYVPYYDNPYDPFIEAEEIGIAQNYNYISNTTEETDAMFNPIIDTSVKYLYIKIFEPSVSYENFILFDLEDIKELFSKNEWTHPYNSDFKKQSIQAIIDKNFNSSTSYAYDRGFKDHFIADPSYIYGLDEVIKTSQKTNPILLDKFNTELWISEVFTTQLRFEKEYIAHQSYTNNGKSLPERIYELVMAGEVKAIELLGDKQTTPLTPEDIKQKFNMCGNCDEGMELADQFYPVSQLNIIELKTKITINNNNKTEKIEWITFSIDKNEELLSRQEAFTLSFDEFKKAEKLLDIKEWYNPYNNADSLLYSAALEQHYYKAEIITIEDNVSTIFHKTCYYRGGCNVFTNQDLLYQKLEQYILPYVQKIDSTNQIINQKIIKNAKAKGHFFKRWFVWTSYAMNDSTNINFDKQHHISELLLKGIETNQLTPHTIDGQTLTNKEILEKCQIEVHTTEYGNTKVPIAYKEFNYIIIHKTSNQTDTLGVKHKDIITSISIWFPHYHNLNVYGVNEFIVSLNYNQVKHYLKKIKAKKWIKFFEKNKGVPSEYIVYDINNFTQYTKDINDISNLPLYLQQLIKPKK